MKIQASDPPSRRLVSRVREGRHQRRLQDEMRHILSHARAIAAPPKHVIAPHDEPVQIKFVLPRDGWDVEKVLMAWGAPLSIAGSQEQLIHTQRAGAGAFNLPPMMDTFAFLAKLAKHRNMPSGAAALALTAVHSQLTLSEAVALVDECMTAGRWRTLGPREWANHWAQFGIHVANIWQARQACDPALIGDQVRCARFFESLKSRVTSAHLEQMDRDADAMRRRFKPRGSTS